MKKNRIFLSVVLLALVVFGISLDNSQAQSVIYCKSGSSVCATVHFYSANGTLIATSVYHGKRMIPKTPAYT